MVVHVDMSMYTKVILGTKIQSFSLKQPKGAKDVLKFPIGNFST